VKFAESGNVDCAALLPVIPLGVALGWWMTHKTEQKHYTALIYLVLLVTSVTLILKAL